MSKDIDKIDAQLIEEYYEIVKDMTAYKHDKCVKMMLHILLSVHGNMQVKEDIWQMSNSCIEFIEGK